METLEKVENHLPVATTPDQLLAMAVDKDLDIDKLTKLVELVKQNNADIARKEFFHSLSQFQANAPEIRKSKQVEFKTQSGVTSYHYAPLSDIVRQITHDVKSAGLCYRWEIQDTKEEISVTCLVTHTSGHTEKTTMRANPDESGGKNKIQARGSAIEYMKRYTLIGALGLTTADSDIDGRMNASLPELDVDKLHKTYMELYEKIVDKDEKFRVPGDPDNWETERTPKIYVSAIGKARQILAKLTMK